MKIRMGPEHVIVQGIRPEEQLWGAYQFPFPYKLPDGIAVSVHIANDGIQHFHAGTKRWFKSTDGGETWCEADPSIAAQCGLTLPNGERLFFPQVGSTDITGYKFTPVAYRTPASDMTRQAPEGVLPLPDGMTFGFGEGTIYGYLADRLPPSLARKEWLSLRLRPDCDTPTEEMVPWTGPA